MNGEVGDESDKSWNFYEICGLLNKAYNKDNRVVHSKHFWLHFWLIFTCLAEE